MAFPKYALIEQRRERVAQLNLRGLSSREIAAALARGDNPIVNPSTGLPYDHKTVLGDLEVLKQQWRESAFGSIDDHIARQYAEMREIKKAAWSMKSPELALKALDREMKLLGTAKDKDGIQINFNLDIVYQIAELAEAQGVSASALFESMLRKLQRANS